MKVNDENNRKESTDGQNKRTETGRQLNDVFDCHQITNVKR